MSLMRMETLRDLHEFYVKQLPVNRLAPSQPMFYASCSCGWRSARYDRALTAHDLASDHARLALDLLRTSTGTVTTGGEHE